MKFIYSKQLLVAFCIIFESSSNAQIFLDDPSNFEEFLQEGGSGDDQTLAAGWTFPERQSCPKIQVVQNFDKDQYLGRWYELYRNKVVPFQKYDCTTAKYSLKPNGYVKVENSNQQLIKLGYGNNIVDDYIEGQARFKDGIDTQGSLQVKFSIFQPVWGSYNVLSTDYTTYAVVYSCRTSFFGFKKTEYAWVLTRKPLDVNYSEQELDINDPDVLEWTRIRDIAQEVLEKQVPGYDFENTLKVQVQGVRNGCIYPKDD